MSPPETCPNCGADVPANAKACPECGSDEQTGWSDEAEASHLNLPDNEFNYEEYVNREFGKTGTMLRGIHWFWSVIGIILLIVIALLWFRH